SRTSLSGTTSVSGILISPPPRRNEVSRYYVARFHFFSFALTDSAVTTKVVNKWRSFILSFALTNSWRRFTHKHINYSRSAIDGLQNGHSARLGLHFADDASVPAFRILSQAGDDRDQLPFVGNVKRIQP